MKLAVEFPSVIYREGAKGVTGLAQAIERAGYNQLDMFDHVIMPWPSESRPGLRYPADMPILEALMALSFVAAATEQIGLGTEVLVLPQRQPVLVAKQVSTLDTLSGGRVRLGVGSGWQESEYEALGADFRRRGKAMDEAVALLRACWQQREVSFDGAQYRVEAMAMEPKPPRPGGPPIWLGGTSPVALRRAGRLGDGWLANAGAGAAQLRAVKQAAEQAGRDPDALGFQAQLSAPPRQGEAAASGLEALFDGIVAAAGRAVADGFDWATVNATVLFRAGARRGEQLGEALSTLHGRLRKEVG
ncbi:MAG TPA: TIGR03619 family F420-dependent LLM class oxidoreductase [Dehalococcoidia bacterium]|nr:TIGR03619 family F420-dependent LLM class oxidoreductase [Dehalococcoidia bacterium]